MSRRRYQTGCVYRRGDVWLGRWREDVVTAEGKTLRKLRTETYSIEDYPTKKLVQRELQRKLAEVNAKNYKAKPQTKFEVFALKWQNTVLKEMAHSNQSAINSQLRVHLIPAFGHIALSNITTEVLQHYVARSTLSSKTTRNLIATMRSMWSVAIDWKLVQDNPFERLKLPKRIKPEVPFFTADDMRRIIEASPEPYKTFFWLAAETGMRSGELCGLRWEDIDLDKGIVQVRQSAWRGKIGKPKTNAGRRCFAISRRLALSLSQRTQSSNGELLFHSRSGRPWDGNLVVKRRLHRILAGLGIARAGLHAFRHGNATVMNQALVPSKVMMSRLGHADLDTTNAYTHVISSDDQKAAEELQRLIFSTSSAGVPPHANQLRVQVSRPDYRPQERGISADSKLTWRIAGGNA